MRWPSSPRGEAGAGLRNEWPARRPRNGHHADCPYYREDPALCAICAGIRKGGLEE